MKFYVIYSCDAHENGPIVRPFDTAEEIANTTARITRLHEERRINIQHWRERWPDEPPLYEYFPLEQMPEFLPAEVWTLTEDGDYDEERQAEYEIEDDDLCHEYHFDLPYAYLGGGWEKGRHRKWVAMLTKPQFKRFLYLTELAAQEVETLGSVTAHGWMPAISFSRDDTYDYLVNAYVTPIPELVVGRSTPEERDYGRDWERIATVIRKKWGN